MREHSIVTTIVAAVGGIVLGLIILGGTLLVIFEKRMIDRFLDEHDQQLSQSIESREQAEQDVLIKNIQFTAKIISAVSSTYLFDFNAEALQHSLQTYLEYSEIMAIQVFTQNGKSFAAAWKASDGMHIADAFPDTFSGKTWTSLTRDVIRDDETLGKCVVYYDDTLLKENMARLKSTMRTETDSFRQDSRVHLDRMLLSQGIGILCILGVLVVCLFLLLRIFVRRPLLAVSETANTLADFDLTLEIQTTRKNDEIGKLFAAIQRMVQAFRNVIAQVQRSGIQVASSATELSVTARQQDATLTNQITSTQHVLESVKQISELAQELVRTMQQVASMSQETAAFASSGQTDLARMKDAMGRMEEASSTISGRLEMINAKADNITNVVVTITKVADQTNLLSLNAAIEAEKAGEYGRGFTVVAREIRRLADQTAVATLDIEQMVKEMQSAVSVGVMEMDKFIAEVRRSVEDVTRISTQLTLIIDQVQALSPNFENVNIAMGQQSENARQINVAMVNLSEEMQDTLVSLRETYAAIGQLNDAANTLHTQVSQFKVA